MGRKRNYGKSPWVKFDSGLFEPPTADVVREVIDNANWTQARAAEVIGASPRNFRRYVSPDQADMPYAEWQLLLYHANYDIGDRATLADKVFGADGKPQRGITAKLGPQSLQRYIDEQ